MLLVIMVGLGGGLSAVGAKERSPADTQVAKINSDQEACNTMKTLLPLQKQVIGKGYRGLLGTKITGSHLTSSGFTLSLNNKPDFSVAYADIKLTDLKNDFADAVAFDAPGYSVGLVSDRAIHGEFYAALSRLTEAAHAGRLCDCTRYLIDTKTTLDAFTQQTAAWRALAAKPALSDDVIKKRLLAEDAIEHKNFQRAAGYYEAGVALDPTWAQGWYNAALIYGEQQDYFDAAFDMKHYLILLPDAPDAAAAKEKLLLWEAKAEEAGGK
jgi:hypothetical protein